MWPPSSGFSEILILPDYPFSRILFVNLVEGQLVIMNNDCLVPCTAGFVKKVASMNTLLINNIYLSHSEKEAEGTYFMKYTVLSW